MFEAHTLSADELKALLKPAPRWLKSYHRTHAATLRPLRIWFAEGKRKDATGVPHRTRFVYIEYRDDRGDNRYRCLERPALGLTIDRLLAEAVQTALPGLGR